MSIVIDSLSKNGSFDGLVIEGSLDNKPVMRANFSKKEICNGAHMGTSVFVRSYLPTFVGDYSIVVKLGGHQVYGADNFLRVLNWLREISVNGIFSIVGQARPCTFNTPHGFRSIFTLSVIGNLPKFKSTGMLKQGFDIIFWGSGTIVISNGRVNFTLLPEQSDLTSFNIAGEVFAGFSTFSNRVIKFM